MNDDDMYVHRPAIVVTREHVLRYPRHYASLGLFLVAMLLVPTVGVAGVGDLASATSPAPSSVPEGALPLTPPSTSVASPAPPATAIRAVADALGVDVDTVATAVDGTVPGPSSAPPGGAPAPAPDDGEDAGPADLALPSPPAVPLPPPPAELEPLLAAVGPLTANGCSGLGLAAVVIAVAGTAAKDVPVGQVLPYLAPVYSACAAFPPPPGEPTVCEIDRAAAEAGYPSDVSGLMKTPQAIGTGIDVLYGIEAAIEAYTGQAPGLVGGLADQLGCTA